METVFQLDPSIAKLVEARNFLREEYSKHYLKFTLDGNLVGDIGEAIAVDMFGIELSKSNTAGIDGFAPDGRSVQIKATGTNRGPAFRNTLARADHLLFFSFDFEKLLGTVVYNGPEDLILANFPAQWIGQRSISISNIIKLADTLTPDQSLQFHV